MTAEVPLSPTLKVNAKKSKKGPSPRKKAAKKMADELEQMKQGQEELKKQSQSNHKMLVEMMRKMSTEQREASDQAKKDTNLVIERVDTLEKRIDKLESGGAAQHKVNLHS